MLCAARSLVYLRMSESSDELDPERVADFERRLLASSRRRIDREQLWRAFADAFPGRPDGREARWWLCRALDILAERKVIVLPVPSGRRWDRSFGVTVPTSVDLYSFGRPRFIAEWRHFPWHPRLQWVADLDRLSPAQERFLRRVHDGLVRGSFERRAPLRHRSLQLTGDEKGLERLVVSKLFASGRLSLAMLGCSAEVPPLVWESVGEAPLAVVFENAGPFAMALEVLRGLEHPPYGIVIWGGGARFERSLPYLATMRCALDRVDYVGDIDTDGLRIAAAAAARAHVLGLPPIQPAPRVHSTMLEASLWLGHPSGWRRRIRRAPDIVGSESCMTFLPEDIRDRVRAILHGGRRIPEEVLGPEDLEALWCLVPDHT